MTPSQITLLQTAYVGDCVLSLTTLRVAARLTQKPCVVVTRPATAQLFQNDPCVRACVHFDKRGTDRSLRGLVRVASQLRSLQAPRAAGLLAQGSWRSALLCKAAGITTRVSFETSPARSLATHTVPRTPLRPWDELRLLETLFPEVPLHVLPHDSLLNLPREALDVAHRALATTTPYIGICVGSARATKKIPMHALTALALGLLDRGICPVLLGSPTEAHIAYDIQRATSFACVDATSTTLLEAAAFLKLCAGALGPDSGLLHLARSVATPTYVFYGPTPITPFLSAPHSTLSTMHTPITRPISCRPCSSNGPRTCPFKHNACMDFTQAEVDDVLERCTLQWLSKNTAKTTP